MPRKKTGADTSNAIFALSCHRQPVTRQMRECFAGGAREAIGQLAPRCEIFGFTKGQFSLIDLISELLHQAGPSHVAIATWTAAHAEIRTAFEFLRSGELLSLRWVVDRSFASRQPEYCRALLDAFGPDCIRITRTHAKFVLIRNERWNLAVRTSMNLNKNPRFEDFEISDDPVLAGYLAAVTDEIFARQDVGELMKRDTASVDRSFRAVSTGCEPPPSQTQNIDDGFDLVSDDFREIGDA